MQSGLVSIDLYPLKRGIEQCEFHTGYPRLSQVALSQEANRARGKSGVAEKKSASPGNKSSLTHFCEHFGYPVIALLVAAAPAKFLVNKNNNMRGHIMLVVEASIIA